MPGERLKRFSPATSSSTASPRYSRRSLSCPGPAGAPLSLFQEAWVIASRSKEGRRKVIPQPGGEIVEALLLLRRELRLAEALEGGDLRERRVVGLPAGEGRHPQRRRRGDGFHRHRLRGGRGGANAPAAAPAGDLAEAATSGGGLAAGAGAACGSSSGRGSGSVAAGAASAATLGRRDRLRWRRAPAPGPAHRLRRLHHRRLGGGKGDDDGERHPTGSDSSTEPDPAAAANGATMGAPASAAGPGSAGTAVDVVAPGAAGSAGGRAAASWSPRSSPGCTPRPGTPSRSSRRPRR